MDIFVCCLRLQNFFDNFWEMKLMRIVFLRFWSLQSFTERIPCKIALKFMKLVCMHLMKSVTSFVQHTPYCVLNLQLQTQTWTNEQKKFHFWFSFLFGSLRRKFCENHVDNNFFISAFLSSFQCNEDCQGCVHKWLLTFSNVIGYSLIIRQVSNFISQKFSVIFRYSKYEMKHCSYEEASVGYDLAQLSNFRLKMVDLISRMAVWKYVTQKT